MRVLLLEHVAELPEDLLVAVDHPLEAVLELADLAPLDVGLRVAVGLVDQALDLVLATARPRD